MVKVVQDMNVVKCSDFTTICPFSNKIDETEYVEILYSDEKYRPSINIEELKSYINSEIEGKKVPIEAIPIKILTHCMEENLEWLKPGRVFEIKVDAKTRKRDEGEMRHACMHVTISFKREWLSPASM